MNNELVKYFMALKYDRNIVKGLADVTPDNVISCLDSNVEHWAYEIEPVNNSDKIVTILYLPGRILSDIGNSYSNSLSFMVKNIATIKESNNSVNNNANQNPSPMSSPLTRGTWIETNASDTKPLTTNNILNELTNMSNKAKDNNTNVSSENNDDVKPVHIPTMDEQKQAEKPKTNNTPFQNLLDNMTVNTSSATETVPPVKEPEEVPFDSKEAQANEQQFQQMLEKTNAFIPSPETINPTNQITLSLWTPEQGTKLKKWCSEVGVNRKEEMSSWFMKYCGLDYDHFNPKYVDNFIQWATDLRERQTY